MRKILFRGKRADNNEWSIGHNILLATTYKGMKRTFICPKGEYMEDAQTKENRLILVLPQVEVIPKSEVDWNSIPVDVGEALKQRAVEKAKAEVAGEIFEEIEKLFFKNGVFIHIHSYNELKKKYTEEKV